MLSGGVHLIIEGLAILFRGIMQILLGRPCAREYRSRREATQLVASHDEGFRFEFRRGDTLG